MFDENEFNAYMARNRMTREKLAKELNISSRTLSTRINTGVFRSNEIDRIVKVLKISNPLEIFFANE